MRFLVVVLLVGILALGAIAVAATVLPDPRPARWPASRTSNSRPTG